MVDEHRAVVDEHRAVVDEHTAVVDEHAAVVDDVVNSLLVVTAFTSWFIF